MTTAVDIASHADVAISCAIVDAGGHMMLLERMDGGRFHTTRGKHCDCGPEGEKSRE